MLSNNHLETILYFLISIILINFSIASFAEMPKNWYCIDDNSEKTGNQFKWEEPNKEFDKDVNDLFEAQGDSYEALLQESNYAHGKSNNSWELSVVRSQLALSADGVLGVLALKGTVAAELRWFRKSFLKEYDSNYDSLTDGAAHATFNPNMSNAEIDDILNTIVEKTFQTGRIANRDLMLSGLREKVNKTRGMLFGVPNTSYLPFSLFRLRIEIIFGASGRVLPIMTAGGDVRIRLDWELDQAYRSNKGSQQPQTERISSDSFEKLVIAFSQDMGVLEKREPFGSKFRVKGFQIRVGQTTGGQVGVANASGSIGGMLFFKKNRSIRFDKNYQLSDPENTSFNLIRSEIPEHTESSFVLSDSYIDKDSQKSSITAINRQRFRQGLKKAEKIGSYLMEQAGRAKQRNWELREIRTDYQFSLAGNIGIATIGGFGELRIEYAKNY